jgi:hypothetical protein
MLKLLKKPATIAILAAMPASVLLYNQVLKTTTYRTFKKRQKKSDAEPKKEAPIAK